MGLKSAQAGYLYGWYPFGFLETLSKSGGPISNKQLPSSHGITVVAGPQATTWLHTRCIDNAARSSIIMKTKAAPLANPALNMSTKRLFKQTSDMGEQSLIVQWHSSRSSILTESIIQGEPFLIYLKSRSNVDSITSAEPRAALRLLLFLGIWGHEKQRAYSSVWP